MKSFIYKYTPSSIDEFNMESKESLHYFKHLLLIGGERTGKTTLASILIQHSDPDTVLHINSLKEQGIQYYRNEVKFFCQTSLVKKIIVIDGLDELNEQAQQIFLNYIDKYGHNVQFIATGTNSQKIIESMYSRFMIVKLYPARIEYIYALIQRVIETEDIRIENDAIPYIVSLSNQCIRTILNYLEKYKIMDILITKEYIQSTHTNIHAKLFETFTNSIISGEKITAVQTIMQLYRDGYSVMDILDAYYTFIKDASIAEELKYKLIKVICKFTVIFNNIHEHHIELLFFVQNCINIANDSHTPHT